MSCLFDSLSVSLDSYSINLTSDQIRQAICDYLAQNNPIIEGFDTKELLDMENLSYVQTMRQNTTMGGAIEIQAACCIWKSKIYVQTNSSEIEFLPLINQDPDLPCIYLRWYGAHYTSTQKIEK